MRVEAGRIVAIEYQVRLDDGEVVEQTARDTPVQYLHGAGMLLPSLEEALQDLEEGAFSEFVLAPESAYGERDEHNIVTLPRKIFPTHVDLVPGAKLAARSGGGDPFPVTVREVFTDRVTVDLNHPLAGKALHFSVVVRSVRPAASEEVFRGKPHDIEVV